MLEPWYFPASQTNNHQLLINKHGVLQIIAKLNTQKKKKENAQIKSRVHDASLVILLVSARLGTFRWMNYVITSKQRINKKWIQNYLQERLGVIRGKTKRMLKDTRFV